MGLCVGTLVPRAGAGLLTWTPASAAVVVVAGVTNVAADAEMPSVTLQAAHMATRPANLTAADSSGYL